MLLSVLFASNSVLIGLAKRLGIFVVGCVSVICLFCASETLAFSGGELNAETVLCYLYSRLRSYSDVFCPYVS